MLKRPESTTFNVAPVLPQVCVPRVEARHRRDKEIGRKAPTPDRSIYDLIVKTLGQEYWIC